MTSPKRWLQSDDQRGRPPRLERGRSTRPLARRSDRAAASACCATELVRRIASTVSQFAHQIAPFARRLLLLCGEGLFAGGRIGPTRRNPRSTGATSCSEVSGFRSCWRSPMRSTRLTCPPAATRPCTYEMSRRRRRKLRTWPPPFGLPRSGVRAVQRAVYLDQEVPRYLASPVRVMPGSSVVMQVTRASSVASIWCGRTWATISS